MARLLEGKVMLITGGASGIGRATALACAREGAKLIIADRQMEGGQHTVHLITEHGGKAIFVRTDVSQAVEVQALISKAVETYGKLDRAHNNAGISGGLSARTAEYPPKTYGIR
jgi:NAD(P)-dependent dehydrogenase (short-subunit alcohol dehydrogenase family)